MLASRLKTYIHDTYVMHTCVYMLCFNYGQRIMYRINVSTVRIVSYRIIDTIHKTSRHCSEQVRVVDSPLRRRGSWKGLSFICVSS